MFWDTGEQQYNCDPIEGDPAGVVTNRGQVYFRANTRWATCKEETLVVGQRPEGTKRRVFPLPTHPPFYFDGERMKVEYIIS